MALIPYAAPATEQPQGRTPEIDWANPLNEGLVFCVPLSDGFTEIVGDYGAGAITGTVLDTPTAQGRGAKFDGSSYLEYGSANIVSDTTPITITLYEECLGTGAYDQPIGFVKGANQWLFIRSPNSGYFAAVGWSGGSPQNFAGLGGLTVGEKIRFVITLPNGMASATGARLWANGVEYTASGTSFAGTTNGTNKIGWSGYNSKWNGLIADVSIRSRIWTDAEVESYFERPGQVYRGDSVLVPVSAGGGGTTISATPGNAAADGTTASVKRTIPATPGNASASGTTASVIRVIGAAPGNAVADGTTAAVTRSIAATPGNAVADGVTATVSTAGTTTISCTPGNADADGALAAITRTIAAAPGNAVANGAIAALLRVIATTPGNAVADGVTAAVQASVTISCTPGNAVADGVAATVTAAVSQLDLILKILRNRQELNPSTGKFTLYDDDGTTVLAQSNAWADVGGTQPYSGGTLARIDALI